MSLRAILIIGLPVVLIVGGAAASLAANGWRPDLFLAGFLPWLAGAWLLSLGGYALSRRPLERLPAEVLSAGAAGLLAFALVHSVVPSERDERLREQFQARMEDDFVRAGLLPPGPDRPVVPRASDFVGILTLKDDEGPAFYPEETNERLWLRFDPQPWRYLQQAMADGDDTFRVTMTGYRAPPPANGGRLIGYDGYADVDRVLLIDAIEDRELEAHLRRQ